MLAIPLREVNEQTSKFGRWLRKSTVVGQMVAAPIVVGSQVAGVVVKDEIAQALRAPVTAVIEIPNDGFKGALDSVCSSGGKSWRDLVTVAAKVKGSDEIMKIAYPCALGKTR